jgi:TetR/AcrR family transcriptional regulator, regulator of mycofactocin system
VRTVTQTRAGRPLSTSHAEIEAIAFELFNDRGFDETTIDDIAEAAGIGRRTFFRYFASKNDIPWGQFDLSLDAFRVALQAADASISPLAAVHRAVVEFNTFEASALPQHRQRMRLIMKTPALQAHSALRYADWRRVIAEYVATSCGLRPTDLLPRLVGQVSLALSLVAYEQWLEDDDSNLLEIMLAAQELLYDYVRVG